MPKRSADQDVASSSKRPKLNGVSHADVEEVESARQLQKLLIFQQDKVTELQNGIRSFKRLLESIVYSDQRSASQQSVLKDYLQSQRPQNHGSEMETLALPGLMEAWSFAVQTNNDGLRSAVPSVLALLLKTMSGLIDFRELGLELCKSLLQTPQLKCIANGLSAPKSKEHVISPNLRLLTEVVGFDGGTFANKIFSTKSFTYDSQSIVRNLSLWKTPSTDPTEDKLRPAVRTNAARYVLACAKFMTGSAKTEILKYGNVMRALLEHLRHDPTDVLEEILGNVKTHVLLEESVPRSVKGAIINEHTLSNIAGIWRNEKADNGKTTGDGQNAVIAQRFLMFACSDTKAGVLRMHAGWYPPGTDKDGAKYELEEGTPEIDLGLDSIEWYNRFRNNVPIRNIALAKFAQSLRPHANTRESELLVKIFEAAPELVADYFFKKAGFAFDPKLTATWIGYSSFLLSTINLPVPKYFGRTDGYGKVPPPASIIAESILPQPLTQKVLTRCLNQKIGLITFFTVRILCVAYQKLRSILAQFNVAAKSEGSLWREGAARVLHEFSKRAPKMKDVVQTFRETKLENVLQTEAVLRLISLCFEITPQAALMERFDVSKSLADALKLAEEAPVEETLTPSDSEKAIQTRGLRLLILNHLLQIANRTPDVRWFNKPQSLKLSPFMQLLKIVVKLSSEGIPNDMYILLDAIIKEHGILQEDTETPVLHALIASLTPLSDVFNASDELEKFIDDAFARVVDKAIKYEDDFDTIVSQLGGKKETGPVSLFAMTLAEQWPFAVEKSDSSINIAYWLGRYILSSLEIGEDQGVLRKIHDDMIKAAKNKEQRQCLLSHDTNKLMENMASLRLRKEAKSIGAAVKTEENQSVGVELSIDFDTFASPPEDPKHRGLHRWSNKDIQSAVVEGDLADLILCLSSAFPEVRRLALTNLKQFAANLDAIQSSYPDAAQIYLLLGLLINTVTPLVQHDASNPNGVADDTSDDDDDGSHPVPYFCTVYAVLALHVLQDPLHPLYANINDFHTRAPKWDLSRLPSHWTHQILLAPPTPSHASTLLPALPTSTPTLSSHPPAHLPTRDPAALAAAAATPHRFLLAYLYHALRTPRDLALLLRRGTLEPLRALAGSPVLPAALRAGVLRVFARAAAVAGGADALVRRGGVVPLLGGLAARRGAGVLVHGGGGGAGGEGEGEDAWLTGEKGLRALMAWIWARCGRSEGGGEGVESWEALAKGVIGDE